jgi:acetaldehyde dehydrogenase (acetylating)
MKMEKKEERNETDLSIKEAGQLMNRASECQKELAGMEQAVIDRIVEAMARAGYAEAKRLAYMAVEETKLGVAEDKVIKNQFATKNLADYIRNMRTAGVIREDREKGLIEIAAPMGVVVGIVPTTNPTSTILYKSIIALKSRNAIVFSPHPRAIGCSMEAARLMEDAAVKAGAPRGVINCLSRCTREATDALMHHPKAAVILATGGSAMVKAAYSSGTPALGVGPGNVPAFIEQSADIPEAIRKILSSKTFDNGTVCASEQAIVTEKVIAGKVMAELKAQGGYFVIGADFKALEKTVILPNGGVNPKVVGQGPQTIAELAGIKIPEGTKVIVAIESGVGKEYPLSAEKLCPVLAFYIENDWKAACERCFELLNHGGLGHSLAIHSQNEQIILEFGLKKPVNRILVNTPSSQGAIGYTTGLAPALTLGCGTMGGSITSDNVSPLHLLNIKRIAYHLPGTDRQAEEKITGYCYTRAEIWKAIEEMIAVK